MTLPMDASELVPHGEPARMVRRLVVCGESDGMAVARIGADHPLARPDGTAEGAGLFELLAQTYAAAGGYRSLHGAEPILEGFLVSVDRFELHAPVPVETDLQISVRRLEVVAECHIIEGEISVDGERLAEGKLKLWIRGPS
ncbi:MAG: hypothetical protein KAI66_10315 [Lentisphaeria bacterium]|nr:hypothetical protein [Lentisphaeria bacterium]